MPGNDPRIGPAPNLSCIPLASTLSPFPGVPRIKGECIEEKVTYVNVVRRVELLDVLQDRCPAKKVSALGPGGRGICCIVEMPTYHVHGLDDDLLDIGLPSRDGHDDTRLVQGVLFV